MTAYAYRGNQNVIDAIEGRLADAGLTREGEVEIADVVITYCTNMTALEDLYFGDEGLVQMMTPGSMAIDLSPAAPSFATEMSAVATVSDIMLVSAPMIVKNKVAEDAFKRVNLGCFAGSEEDGVERAMPVLEAIFGDIQTMPNVASAQLARAANVLQNTAEMVAAVEVLSLFKSCAKSMPDLDMASIVPDATSPEAFFIMKAIKDSHYKGPYTVEMLMGELSAAIMCADDCELILPQAEAAFHLFELLAIVGGVDLTPAALELVYEGEGSEQAAKLGLDWQRMETLYGTHDHDHEDGSMDGFLDEMDFSDGDDFDDISSDFGYSVN